eukprot:CAMPEP_0182554324 /NCGR_PEP_ID=MMETSP1323-20130603/49930_1 /TAXON_ID=236787 /ORGANISM="Florenciella parvula, Strain RCC1693" /LENGTH=240 /DNA_ID=CAMNT_0024766049 /DNA_START=57 /DNA_END=779 /DNA_ORIENTATION=+
MYAKSSSGLVCSHGSDLDTKIARPKQPKTALPPELRAKMGLKPRRDGERGRGDGSHETMYSAGAGVLKPVGSGADGSFLKRGSGVPMSERTSGLARQRGDAVGARAHIARPELVGGSDVVGTERVRRSDREVRPAAASARSTSVVVVGGPQGGGGGGRADLPHPLRNRNTNQTGGRGPRRKPGGGAPKPSDEYSMYDSSSSGVPAKMMARRRGQEARREQQQRQRAVQSFPRESAYDEVL